MKPCGGITGLIQLFMNPGSLVAISVTGQLFPAC